jgi:hypothetical protein
MQEPSTLAHELNCIILSRLQTYMTHYNIRFLGLEGLHRKVGSMKYTYQELVSFQFDDYYLINCSWEAEYLDSAKF